MPGPDSCLCVAQGQQDCLQARRQRKVSARDKRANQGSGRLHTQVADEGTRVVRVPTFQTAKANGMHAWLQAVRRYWTKKIASTVLPLAEAHATFAQIQAQVYTRTLERFSKWHDKWSAAVACVAELDCLASLARASSAMGGMESDIGQARGKKVGGISQDRGRGWAGLVKVGAGDGRDWSSEGQGMDGIC